MLTSVVRIAAVTSVPSTDTRRRVGVGADLERQVAGGGGHGIRVGEVEAALEAPPRERAVHRPRVEVADAEPAGHGLGDAALAGARGAVDRDRQGCGHGASA